MNSYILAINMQHGGGAEKQIDLLLSSGEFKKLIMLESQCEYDISPSDIITLSQHTNKTNPIYKLLCCPVYAYRLYKILKIENDIVIFSVLERANYVNCITKIFLNHKALVNVQVDIFSHYKTGIKKLNFLIMKLLYKRADIVSANSQLSLIDVSEYCGVIESKQLFIPNFYDTKKLRKLSEQKLSTNEEALFQRKVIIGTGRLSEQKCPGRIIRIFRRVLVSDNDAKLVLLNDGILRDKTIEFSKSLGLRTYSEFSSDEFNLNYDVYFLGLKSNPYKYTVRSSIHAHTSLYEGAPNALIESVLLGVRSVASDCRTGPREIIASHTPMEKQAHEVEYYEDGVLMPRFNSGDSFRLLECDRVEELWVDALLNLLSSQLNSKSAIRDVSESVIRRYCMSNMDNYVEKIVNNP